MPCPPTSDAVNTSWVRLSSPPGTVLKSGLERGSEARPLPDRDVAPGRSGSEHSSLVPLGPRAQGERVAGVGGCKGGAPAVNVRDAPGSHTLMVKKANFMAWIFYHSDKKGNGKEKKTLR